MIADIVHYLSEEEQELARKREELAILQAELTDREMLLENLRLDLATFEGRYLREVGVLYAELDDWNAKIAELAAEADGSEKTRSDAAAARAQADESYAAAHSEAAKAVDFSPSPELKKLYREVVNQIHPDRASDESDRTLRERLMKEANAAHRRSDAEALRRILEEYRSSPESVKGEGVTADLQRIVRQILQISKRLARIEAEMAELTSSEIAMLMAKVETAAADGRDLLVEMAKHVTRRIQLARSEFEDQSSKLGAR
jgi:peptidoglycan hydrolase CwlO-like protein